MTIPIVYADFNGLQTSRRNPDLYAIPLDTYGSLKDLSDQSIRLADGMPLVVYMDSAEQENIEADAIVYFDKQKKCWLAEVDKKLIRYVPLHALENQREFLCFQCRNNLEAFIRENGLKEDTTCPDCGLRIMHSIAYP